MRILALHGSRQNGEVFRTRLAPVVTRLEDAGHQVVFVDAPHELPMGVGDEVPMRTWWSSGGGDVRDTTGWDTSLEALREMWTSRGPFQGIIGFSQGASAGLILCELADAADECFASLRCAVLCAGYVVPSPARAVPNPIVSSRIRAMIIAGDADEAVPPADTLACAHRFHSSITRTHPGNHAFPSKSQDTRAVAEFFDETDVIDKVGTPGPGDVDQSPGMSEEVAEELEALAAIFDDEMRIESSVPDRHLEGGPVTVSFTLPGVAEAMDPTDPSSYDPRVALTLPRSYPGSCPAPSLLGIPGTVAGRMSPGLVDVTRVTGEGLLGEAMLFSIVSEVREWAEGAARDAVAAGEFATVAREGGTEVNGDEENDADPDNVNPAGDDEDDEADVTNRWWEAETTDQALVEAATMEALEAETALGPSARAHVPVRGGGGGRWSYTIGLVGKPSAGKSSFFNAATELGAGDAGLARCAPHPFTTIEPNVGRAFAPAPCPCAVAGLSDVCEPSHGRESVGGVHCRRIPVFVKDVAGLVPGAHAGRGRGNAFLNDLCDADVLIHVIDASGRTDREGVDQVGAGNDADDLSSSPDRDPAGDVQWVREELHHWIFGNVRRKWRSVRRKPEKLQDLFVGYHCVRATADVALERMPDIPDPRAITRERILAWTEHELHLLVAHFLRVRFPILLALNKADLTGASARIEAVKVRWGGEPAVSVSATASRWCFEAKSRGDLVEDGDGVLTWVGGDGCVDGGEAYLTRLDAAGVLGDGTAMSGVRRALKAAVALKPPVLGFPVDDLDTGASCRRTGRCVDDASTGVGALRECVVLRPGSTVWDMFSAAQSRGGGGGGGEDGASVAARGEFVRAECRDGPDGCRRRLLRRDEAIHEGNCVVKFYTNRKASWQGKKK